MVSTYPATQLKFIDRYIAQRCILSKWSRDIVNISSLQQLKGFKSNKKLTNKNMKSFSTKLNISFFASLHAIVINPITFWSHKSSPKIYKSLTKLKYWGFSKWCLTDHVLDVFLVLGDRIELIPFCAVQPSPDATLEYSQRVFFQVC